MIVAQNGEGYLCMLFFLQIGHALLTSGTRPGQQLWKKMFYLVWYFLFWWGKRFWFSDLLMTLVSIFIGSKLTLILVQYVNLNLYFKLAMPMFILEQIFEFDSMISILLPIQFVISYFCFDSWFFYAASIFFFYSRNNGHALVVLYTALYTESLIYLSF